MAASRIVSSSASVGLMLSLLALRWRRRRDLDPASGVEPVFAVEDLVLRGLVVMVIVFGRVR